MPILQASSRTLLWAVTDGGAVIETGTTHPGETTITGEWRAFAADPDEQAFLGKVAGKAAGYRPLPPAGEWVEAGAIYSVGADLVIVRQSHVRTTHAPADVPALFSVYRAGGASALDWIANERVEVGYRRVYQGVTYECIQAHTTQTDWTPPATPSLWRVVVEPTPGTWTPGVAYRVGDEVLYQGTRYRCRQAHTAQAGWEPPVVPALWLAL